MFTLLSLGARGWCNTGLNTYQLLAIALFRAGGLDSCAVQASCMVGGGVGLHSFCLGGRLLDPPFPLFFLSHYRLLACGLACPVTQLWRPRSLLRERPLGIEN